MRQPLEHLSRMIYPGRLIAIGRDASGDFNVVIYAITGRSASSQARKLVLEQNAVWTKPTDPEALAKGNPDLLLYPALVLGRGIAVSNGKQTSDIDAGSPGSPVHALDHALKNWTYEPDAPIYTPRISGCVLPSNRAALSVIKRADNGEALRFFFELPLIAGKGKMISTYSGENKDRLPSFHEEPIDLELEESSTAAMAEAVYAALGPQEAEKDFRVAVACLFAKASDMTDHQFYLINRTERMRT